MPAVPGCAQQDYAVLFLLGKAVLLVDQRVSDVLREGRPKAPNNKSRSPIINHGLPLASRYAVSNNMTVLPKEKGENLDTHILVNEWVPLFSNPCSSANRIRTSSGPSSAPSSAPSVAPSADPSSGPSSAPSAAPKLAVVDDCESPNPCLLPILLIVCFWYWDRGKMLIRVTRGILDDGDYRCFQYCSWYRLLPTCRLLSNPCSSAIRIRTSSGPSSAPSSGPSSALSSTPSSAPSAAPSAGPSSGPSSAPSAAPKLAVVDDCESPNPCLLPILSKMLLLSIVCYLKKESKEA
jgi:hypothetical protein